MGTASGNSGGLAVGSGRGAHHAYPVCSDRVFEPTWWQKLLSLELRHVAWQALLVLPLLLVASAYLGSRFAAAPVVHNAGGTATAEFRMTAETDAHIRQLVDQQVKAQVTKVVAEMESEDAKQTQALLASFREQYHRDHQGLLRALDTAYQQQNQRMNRVMYATLEKIPVAN